MKTKALKSEDKKQILARFIELMVYEGIDITSFIYKPLSHWDYDALLEEISNREDQEDFVSEYKQEENAVELKETDLYESPMKDRNEDKFGWSDGAQCVCCMKPLNEGHNKFVHMNTDWKAVNTQELPDSESQGFFEIGNACAKKMPKEFIFEM
jgi:hypothetical protein